MESDDYTIYIIYTVYPALSKCSLTLASLAFITMISLSIYDYKLVNRVSLRLQTAIAIYDIWLHSLPLWSRPYNYEGSPLCVFIAFQGIFFRLFYSFLNVAIGVNLQLIFIHSIRITKKIEAAYWICALFFSLLVSIPSLVLDKLGYGEFNKCYLKGDADKYAKIFDFYAVQSVMLFCMIYLIVIVILVILKLKTSFSVLYKHGLNMNTNYSYYVVDNVRMITYRIILNPLVMVTTHSILVISQAAYDLVKYDGSGLLCWSYITGGLLGTLNFIAFCFDPTIISAFITIYYQITNKEGESHDQNEAEAETNVPELYTFGSFENQPDNVVAQVDDIALQEHQMNDFIKCL